MSVLLGLPVLALHVYYLRYQTYVYVGSTWCLGLTTALVEVKGWVACSIFLSRRLRLDQVLNAIGIGMTCVEMLLSLFMCITFYRYSQL